MSKKLKYYSIDSILEKNAHYNIIIGERSNGKTTAVLRYALQHYFETGKQIAYVRRWDDDLKGGRGASVWSGIVALGFLDELSGGEWTHIIYKGRAWYLAIPDPKDDGKYMLDLKKINRIQLEEAGAARVLVSEYCTKCNEERFFSHRRDHGRTGRMAAGMILLSR